MTALSVGTRLWIRTQCWVNVSPVLQGSPANVRDDMQTSPEAAHSQVISAKVQVGEDRDPGDGRAGRVLVRERYREGTVPRPE